MSNVNTRFKELRTTLKCNQKDFADSVGISRTHLSGIENGKDNPSMPLIKLVCLKYGVNEEWLIDEKGDMFSKYNSFDMITDEGLNTKYQVMKDFLEKMITEQSGDNLKNIVEAYSHFVSLVTMPKLSEDNQKNYLESFFLVNSILEQITYSSYMLKSVSPSNYKALLQYKTQVDIGISKIDENIKKMLSCYLIQYGKDLTL